MVLRHVVHRVRPAGPIEFVALLSLGRGEVSMRMLALPRYGAAGIRVSA